MSLRETQENRRAGRLSVEIRTKSPLSTFSEGMRSGEGLISCEHKEINGK